MPRPIGKDYGEWDSLEETKAGAAKRISNPLSAGPYRQLEKLIINQVTGELKVIASLSSTAALTASTATIGVVGTHQKLLAAMYADTTANLAASAVFTGTSRDTQVGTSAPYLAFGSFKVAVATDKAGSLYIEESTDGTTWAGMAKIDGASTEDSTGATKVVASTLYNPSARYVRLAWKNTSGDTTTFMRIWSRVIG